MSLFFLKLSLLTYGFSHFLARRTRPNTPKSFVIRKKIQMTQKQWMQHLEQLTKKSPLLHILEKRPGYHLISESPRLFSYGCFYHIKDHETPEGLVVEMAIQAKLVTPPQKGLQVLESLSRDVKNVDVG